LIWCKITIYYINGIQGNIMTTNLQISLYSYRFIRDTLFPGEEFKSSDVKPGGKLYCLTQVFLDKISSEDILPVELLFTARSDESNFRSYKIENQESSARLAKKVSLAFKQLTHQSNHYTDDAVTFLKRISKFCDRLHTKKEKHELDPKFAAAFEAVEQCLKANSDKLQSFETILSDWSKASPGFRAKAINFDPFIGALCKAIEKL
jgi:hypothetical protein